MIVYESNLATFINYCDKGMIATKIAEEMHNAGISFSPNEEHSWHESLPFVAKALNDKSINGDINVAIEYQSRINKSRVDFLVYGKDDSDYDSIIIIELKQWSKVQTSTKQNYIYAFGGGGHVSDYPHPSYQSLRYRYLLKEFNEYVQNNCVNIKSCSFCHNMDNIYSKYINDERTYAFLNESPIFLKDDAQKLKEFVTRYVKKSSRVLLYEIDNSKIRPSKDFSNLLYSALEGKPIFTLDDGQAASVATIIDETNKAIEHNKRKTIIIKGGPGSGKSVVAINAMGQLIHPKDENQRKNVCYCTVNFTPRSLYSELLIQDDYKKTVINNLFKPLAAFSRASECDYDCVMFDEAHRNYTWKFGNGVKKSIDMIDKAFYASRVNVWFIDEDQAVTKDDYLTIDKIKQYAHKYNSEIIEADDLQLTSQFRCLGGQAYIDFVNYFLGYSSIKIRRYRPKNYDFKVFDTPSQMWEAIKELQEHSNARLLAGYTHEWLSKTEDSAYDFNMDDGKFKFKWNKFVDQSFINDSSQKDRIGCIHTIQGVDMTYAGVILGKDILYRDGKILFNKKANANTDTASGIRNAEDWLAEKLIRNTYKVLLTRGIYGTYVYCEDEELNNYLKSLID